MIIFGAIAWVTGHIYTGGFDLYRVLRNIGTGAAFPPSLLLFLYPVSERARALFGAEVLKGYLMLAGATAVVLSLYGLFRR
jgi:hypothetical protein